MKIVSATEVKSHLGEYLDEATEHPVFVEKYGRPRAVIISYKRYLSLIAHEERVEGINTEEQPQEQDPYPNS